MTPPIITGATADSVSIATKLDELAARCEQATGPDRELDALLHCVREELEFVLLSKGSEIYGEICDPSDSGYGSRNTCSPGMLYARYPDHKNPPTLGGGKRGNKVQGCTPDHYTASLDAAITLVPEGLSFEVRRSGTGDKGQAMIWDPMRRPGDREWRVTGCKSPALALCAAALRARAAQ